MQAARHNLPLPAAGADDDVQARTPAVAVGLSRVGVTGVEKVVRIRDELFFARLDCFVDLGPDQKGAHMSRFEEVVNEAIGEVVLSESPFRAETLAQHIAELVRARQGACAPRSRSPRAIPSTSRRRSRASPRRRSTRCYGRAVAFEHGTRRIVGVSATGMTACPCAQELVAARARERLAEDGFCEEQIERILERCPSRPTTSAAWHAAYRLHRGCTERDRRRERCWRSSRRACPLRSTS